jgi:hypothetical protein
VAGDRVRIRRALAGAASLALVSALAYPAHAHLMTTGLGPFYDGLGHLLLTPADLLPVLALALLAGLRGPDSGRAVLFSLPLAWLAGICAGAWLAGTYGGAWLAPQAAPSVFSIGLLIALGALAAADARVPRIALVVLALVLGLSGGAISGSELAASGSFGVFALGVASALFAVVSLVAGNVAALRAGGARIAVRVAGSWLAATGMLMLGWSLRG